MLTLGVKVGEYVQIGDNIKVCITRGHSELLKLRIDAPKEVTILRGEVLERMQAEEQKKQLPQ